MRDIAITGNNLHFILGKEGSDTDLHCEQLKLLVDSFDLLSTTGYAAAFDHCMVDQEQGTLDLFCLSAGPTLGLEAHSATMRFEGDVYQARLDTVNARGLDVERLLAQRNCSARSVFVTSGDIAILRDKTLPDGPDPVKPLLARVVRGFSSGSGADTVVLRGVDITYQERGSRSRGFALIPFSAVNGTITGVRNNASDTAQLAINAECVAFGTAPVRLAFTTAINDTTDRFNVSAWIGALPFNALNTATVPLANIRATEGVMDSLIFEMHADDRNAHGTVRMTYAGLKLDSGWKRDSDLMQDVKTALLNTLVRDKNNERDGVAKPGKYTLARHRNRSVFNYLWSGLREGVKAVLLPQAVSGQEQ